MIKDIAMLSIYSSVSTVRHGSRSLSRHLESPQYISLMTSHRAHGVDSHRMAVLNVSLFSVSFITSVSLPPPSPSRSFTRPIFRAVFDSRSSFFAPKPHGNACYASYFTSHTVDIWMMLPTISSPGVENEKTLGTRLNNVMSSVMSRFPTAAMLNVKIGRVLRQHHFSCFSRSYWRKLLHLNKKGKPKWNLLVSLKS